MTVFNETAHAAEFILSEANGQLSRENGEVASGQDLAAGTVVAFDGGSRLVAYTGDEFTNGEEDEAQGVLIYPTDATGGVHVKASYIARHAEVNLGLLTYPAAKEAVMIQSLKRLGIVCR